MTSPALADGEPVIASADEKQSLTALEKALDSASSARLVQEGEQSVEVPQSVREVMVQAIHALAAGHAVTVMSRHAEVTTQQAADLLNVSRPYLIRLIDRGSLPCTRTAGGHRRLRLSDVLDYKHARDADRKTALDELTAEAERLGLDY